MIIMNKARTTTPTAHTKHQKIYFHLISVTFEDFSLYQAAEAKVKGPVQPLLVSDFCFSSNRTKCFMLEIHLMHSCQVVQSKTADMDQEEACVPTPGASRPSTLLAAPPVAPGPPAPL